MISCVDLLGTLTIESCSLSHPILHSTSDANFEPSIGRVVRLTTIQTLTLTVTVSLTAAQFFATFQLLPHTRLGSTLATPTYTVAAIALIVVVAQRYWGGEIEWDGAITSLFALTWGVIFGGNTIAAHSIFSRVFKCLSKYRVSTIEPRGSPQHSFAVFASFAFVAWICCLGRNHSFRSKIAGEEGGSRVTIDPLVLLCLYTISFLPFLVLGIASLLTRRYARQSAIAKTDQSTRPLPLLVRVHGITVRTVKVSLIANLGATAVFFGVPLLVIAMLWPEELPGMLHTLQFWILLWIFMSLWRVCTTSPDPTGGLGQQASAD